MQRASFNKRQSRVEACSSRQVTSSIEKVALLTQLTFPLSGIGHHKFSGKRFIFWKRLTT
jgi:hypothetical protein